MIFIVSSSFDKLPQPASNPQDRTAAKPNDIILFNFIIILHSANNINLLHYLLSSPVQNISARMDTAEQ